MSRERTETFAAFARRVGVSRQVIGRAVASGRLARSVGVHRGRRRVVDVDLALREWRENWSRVPRTASGDAEAEDARPRRQARGLVRLDQFVFGQGQPQVASIFAGQTGGAFANGGDGLTAEQLARVNQAIADL